MTGTNYYGSFDGTTIAMSTPLPARSRSISTTRSGSPPPPPAPVGSTNAYGEYKLNSGVIDPPVYVKYYQKTTASTVFLSGDPITYRISYSDLDNDPPTYHAGVQGYVKVVFPGIVAPHFLMPLTMPPNYLTPVPLYVTVTDTPEGTQKYYYLGSDGYDPQHQVRFPVAADPARIDANDPSAKVNYKPVLSAASLVNPMAGLPSASFTFTVKYKDTDGAGTTPSVTLRLIKIGDEAAIRFSGGASAPAP